MAFRRASLVLASLLLAASVFSSEADKRLRQLSAQLTGPDPQGRVAAALALSQFRPLYRGVVVNLIDRLFDGDERVRKAAQDALRSLATVSGFEEVAKGLDRPPRVIALERPQYPEEAKARQVEGQVLVELTIADDGTVTDVRTLRGVEGLTEAATLAARKWLFVPAVKNGRLVQTTAQAPVVFRADPPLPWVEKP